jgi:hypothetical protein
MTDAVVLQIIWICAGGVATISSGLLLWGLKALIAAVVKNTSELAVLSSKIDGIMRNNDKIPKLEADVAAVHSKIRQVIRDTKR